MGSVIPLQLAFLGENDTNFPWEKFLLGPKRGQIPKKSHDIVTSEQAVTVSVSVKETHNSSVVEGGLRPIQLQNLLTL